MNQIDLHVHSNCSDGTMTPTELVERAVSNHLSAFALTDHDTVAGVAEALAAGDKAGLTVIPGVELSVDYNGKEIHILGYHLDYTNQELIDRLEWVATERDNRNIKMCQSLNDAGYPITYEELTSKYGDGILTRAHFAKFLLEKDAIPSMDAAFKGPLANNSPYFIPRRYLTPKEAIDLIHMAGGVAVLAHPLLYKLSVTEINKLIHDLKDLGLQGIEAKYSCNKGNDEAFVMKLAKDHNLFVTGGSDFHGANKPHIELGNGMGTLFVPEDYLEHIKPGYTI